VILNDAEFSLLPRFIARYHRGLLHHQKGRQLHDQDGGYPHSLGYSCLRLFLPSLT
jgi:hypothetical protein